MNNTSDKPIVLSTGEWEYNTKKTPVYTVLSAVAEASETALTELPPLYKAINPDALKDLFISRTTDSTEQVRFQYAGYTVIVRDTGEVQVISS